MPIHPRLRPYLEGLPASDLPYLFCAPPGKKHPKGDGPLVPKRLNGYLQRLAEGLKMPTGRKGDGLVVHSLRHVLETHCVNSGIVQRVIDVWMGHTGDKSMGSVYYRLGGAEAQAFMSRVPF